MTSAPEKISIKRKRSEVPVDHLIYQSKKQRTTDHVFVRIVEKPRSTTSAGGRTSINDPSRSENQVPTIRATQPGDEIKDFRKYKALQELRDRLANGDEALPPDLDQASTRRFHLTRDLSLTARNGVNVDLRKQKLSQRPHLATFVERRESNQQEGPAYLKEPADKVLRPTDGSQWLSVDQILGGTQAVERQSIATFSKPELVEEVSDDLADRLLAFALELDPEAKAAYDADPVNRQQFDRSDAMLVDDPNDFIFETYVRMGHDNLSSFSTTLEPDSYGVLVIDDENEELWKQYLRDEDDEDDEWDSEDGDSNAEDNPRNDYPDEELSEDDEYGTNLYKYRRYGSDDEQYDEDY